jgi:hypothetical protein
VLSHTVEQQLRALGLGLSRQDGDSASKSWHSS